MKVAGTFKLDGLLQGRLPLDPEFDIKARVWLAEQHARGLHFDYAVDGGSFSVLPDDQAHRSADFSEGVEVYLTEAYQGFLGLAPQSDAQLWMSTLRSTRYLSDQEVQSLYVVAPPGRIEMQTRTVDAQTVTATKPERMKKTHLAGLGILLLLLLIAGSVVDWQRILQGRTESPAPVLLDMLILDASAFDQYLFFEKTAVDKGHHRLILKARVGDRWAEAMSATQPDISSWKNFHAISSIKKGFLRCEIYGAEDRLLSVYSLPVADLMDAEGKPVDLFIPLPAERVHRVVIGPS